MIAASAWLAALAATIAPITKEIFLSKVEVAGPDGRWTLLAEPRDGDVHVVALTAISPLLPRVEVRRGRSTPVTPGPALSAQVEVAVNAGNRPLDCAPRPQRVRARRANADLQHVEHAQRFHDAASRSAGTTHSECTA